MNQDDFFNEVAVIIKEKWRSHANCKGIPPQTFFDPTYEDYVKLFCKQCPVKLECLNSALISDDEFIRGGMTAFERRSVANHYNRNRPYYNYDVLEGLLGKQKQEV